MTTEAALESLEAERARLSLIRPNGPLLRPRDAGTLIVVDRTGPMPRLLMGRRSPGHVFMPGHYVFPGGGVDPADLRLAASFALSDDAVGRLCAGPPSRFDPRRATAVALAAIRETFEETGTMVGAPGSLVIGSGYWRPFAERAIRPSPEMLVPLARAITPPGPPRRYDTRFFCVDATALAHGPVSETPPTDELEAVGWFTLDEIRQLPIATITRRVLVDLEQRLANDSWLDASRPMPFYRVVRGRFVRELL
ncbi:MAG: NUDIX hydrolase [Aurantimonas endophytica]|uniref:8-oxo-dGTP pyrophosphatase MutT (NUDIX family) n=1 Tax=Aurantimonas endophytica TaxID=1522175 RepID=A0A7W6HAV7_9HYPH|nr:8-oxo-dGTP pyrophosphatase MutT (NUDIX family) [Aurantimonas endophytica]